MTCLYCKGPVELNIRTGNPKKYCSKKCSSKFYRNEERYYKKKNADWGTRGEKERQRKLKAQKEFEWYSTNWLTAAQVAKEIGLTISAVHARAKKRGLKPTIRTAGSGPGAPTTFFSPEEVETIKQPYIAKPVPIPEGYMTREQFEMAIGVGSWGMSKQYRVERCLKHKTYSATGVAMRLSLWHESKVDLYFKLKAKHDAAVEVKRQERLAAKAAKAAAKQRARDEHAILTQGRLKTSQAADYVGCNSTLLTKAKLPHIIVKGHKYYSTQSLDKFKERYLAKRALTRAKQQERRQKYSRRGVPKRQDIWTSTEVYEKRLFKSFPKKLAKYKLAGNDSKYKGCIQAIGANEEWARLASTGVYKQFYCNTCKLNRPYHGFYFEASSTTGRRTTQCKDCNKKVRRAAYSKPDYKKPERTPTQKLRVLIACHVKSEISIHRDAYATDLSVGSIWDSLPYTAKELTEHLESQFDENMNWDNHGQLKPERYTWQIDHIRPRTDFEYTTLDDSQYQECWSLDNMRPLSAKENSLKGSGSE
jgi:hypothetical protein